MLCAAGITSLLAGAVLAAPAFTGTVPAEIVLAQGESPEGGGGLVVTTLNAPFTNGFGAVGFVGVLEDAGGVQIRFIWYDDGIIFLSSDPEPDILTGGEGTMGIGDDEEFVYSPTFNGEDAAYSQAGLLLRETDPAPGFPGMFSSFNSRPTMLPDGTAHWICGLTNTMGGGSQGRTLYRANTNGEFDITPLLTTGDEIEGFTVQAPAGLDFDYGFSDDGMHHVHVVDTVGDSDNDGFVYLDGTLVLREDDPINEVEAWDNFDTVDANNAGHWIVTGDTNGDTGSDEFIAYDGAISVREGDTVDGFEIASGMSVRAASLNDFDQVAYVFGNSDLEGFFVGDGPALAETSVLLLQTGDEIDLDGDTIGDATIDDINASGIVGPALDLAEDGFVYIELSLLENGAEDPFDAIVRLAIATPCLGDLDGDGLVSGADLGLLLGAWGSDDPDADLNGDGIVEGADLGLLLGAWGVCDSAHSVPG